MKTKARVLACCTHIKEDIWKIFWIEHGRSKSKYVKAEKNPNFTTFSQLKRKKEIPEKEVLRRVGVCKEMQLE